MSRAHRGSDTIFGNIRPMAHFSLVYRRDGSDPDRRIEFHGEDPGRALHLVHREAVRGPAELWKDGELLCTISRIGERPDCWMIGPGG